MNILICSVGRRVKLIKYFKEEVNKIGGKIVAVDCDATAPALYFADFAEIVPNITDPDYLQNIGQLCKKYKINAILSLIDPELSLLAEHREFFEKENIKIIVSNSEVVNICRDKYLTYKFLEKHNLPGIPTYLKIEEIVEEIENNKLKFPLIIKPKNGSASIGITVVNSITELRAIWKGASELIAQPFIDGDEFGVDCYVDIINLNATNIFCKRKLKMRAGETDKSVSVNDPILLQLIESFLTKLNPIGPIDIDCFKTDNGFIISEINPRFGGGYPHAHESGQNFVKNIINNLAGKSNESIIGKYYVGTVMMKFDDVMIQNEQNEPINQNYLKEGIACTR